MSLIGIFLNGQMPTSENQDIHHHQHRISTKLNSARTRLRQFSRDYLTTPFRRSQNQDINLTPSPSPSPSPSSNTSTGQCSEPGQATPMSSSSTSSASDGNDNMNRVMDGTAERALRKSQQSQTRPHISAIFVHAGAGYHSTTNEHIHLGACNE